MVKTWTLLGEYGWESVAGSALGGCGVAGEQLESPGSGVQRRVRAQTAMGQSLGANCEGPVDSC